MTVEEKEIYYGTGAYRGVDFHKLRCYCDEWEPMNPKAFHPRYCPFCGVPLALNKGRWGSHRIREHKRGGMWIDERGNDGQWGEAAQ